MEELEKFNQSGGLTLELMEKVVPVPSSADVLGHLKGEVEIEFSHRVVGSLVWADLQAIDVFWKAWVEVVADEYRQYRDCLAHVIE